MLLEIQVIGSPISNHLLLKTSFHSTLFYFQQVTPFYSNAVLFVSTFYTYFYWFRRALAKVFLRFLSFIFRVFAFWTVSVLIKASLSCLFQEIAAILISFDKHSEWQSKEVKTR